MATIVPGFFQRDQPWSLFNLFSFIFVISPLQHQLQFQLCKLKKHRWCPRDLNLGPQDGKRRRNHRAMAAASYIVVNTVSYDAWVLFNPYENVVTIPCRVCRWNVINEAIRRGSTLSPFSSYVLLRRKPRWQLWIFLYHDILLK